MAGKEFDSPPATPLGLSLLCMRSILMTALHLTINNPRQQGSGFYVTHGDIYRWRGSEGYIHAQGLHRRVQRVWWRVRKVPRSDISRMGLSKGLPGPVCMPSCLERRFR